MVNGSFYNLADKPYVSSASKSTIDKEDFIKERLRRLEIAYATIARYPDVLNEFVNAVKVGPQNPPEPRQKYPNDLREPAL